MRKLITVLFIILLIGCEKEVDKPTTGVGECSSDSDCITGGCSGTVCQSKDAPPVFTTCVYLPEYDCYKDITCGCVDGRCDWDKTDEFEKCVMDARESTAEVVA